MMRKLLRTIALLGVLALVFGVILHQAGFPVLAVLSSVSGTALEAIRQWIRGATAHLTTTQIVEGAGLAWLLFVLALVLLARSGRNGSRAHNPQRKTSSAVIVDDAPPHRTQSAEMMAVADSPTLPLSHTRNEAPGDYFEITDDTPYGYGAGGPAEEHATSDVLTERRAESGPQPAQTPGIQSRQSTQRSRSHVLALTGIARTDRQLVPYGLFVVAEDIGMPRSAGMASRRAVQIIAQEMAPSLAGSTVHGGAQLAALLKMSVMRASLDLREQGIRAATNFEASVTGVMVIGDVAQVVNVGDCRTYVFRPNVGLLQVTTDHSVTSCLVDNGLLQPDAMYQHPRRDQVYRSVGGDRAATEIDAFEIHVRPDDLLLLCSSGLWKAVRLAQTETILEAAPDPQSAADRLAREGAGRTGDDDFGIIVVQPLGEWMPRFGVPAKPARVP